MGVCEGDVCDEWEWRREGMRWGYLMYVGECGFCGGGVESCGE